MTNYYNKYIKYKAKYLEYKNNIYGGSTSEEKNHPPIECPSIECPPPIKCEDYDPYNHPGFNYCKTYFPNVFDDKGKDVVDYKNLQLTYEGTHSITYNHYSLQIIELMEKKIGTLANRTIIDLSANVGGDTIRFGLNFKSVRAIEYDKCNYNVLVHNVNEYGLLNNANNAIHRDKLKNGKNNVTLFLDDSTELYQPNLKEWKTDIIYIDPPWGGPDYKCKDSITFSFGGKKLEDYISSIRATEFKPSYIFMKLPWNHNPKQFERFKPTTVDITKNKGQKRAFNILIIDTNNVQ